MKGIIYVLFAISVVFFKRDEKSFALAAWSIQTQSVPEEYLQAIKVEFSKPVVEALLRFGGFHRKFGVPYLYVKSALTYATEIAKATAYSPLFSSSEGIEDFALRYLLRMLLPCSPAYCPDVNCVATTIGEILAEIITEGGFVTHRVSNHVIKMYAGNLAGNILWRLSRLPDPDSHMSLILKDAPLELVDDYAQFVRFLSVGIRNSTFISEFCEDRGIDADTSRILLTSVCGSRFLNFKLGYADELTTEMVDGYSFAKRVLPQDLEFSQSFSIVSSIIAETITFRMIKENYLQGDEDLEEVSRDVLKMISLGITSSKMDLGSSHSFVKYSSFKNKKVNTTSNGFKQTLFEQISSELSESDIFQRLFNGTQISSENLEKCASAMAAGLTRNVTSVPDDISTGIVESLTRILSTVEKSTKIDPSKDTVKMFSDGIAEELIFRASQLKFVDMDNNSSAVLSTFHTIVQDILLSLEKIHEKDFQRKDSVTDDFSKKFISIPKSVFDVMSTISNFFSSIV